MGDAGQQADGLFGGDGEEVLGRVLLQDAVDNLDAVDVALFHAELAFLKPADIGAEGGAVESYFALVLEVLQSFKYFVAFDGGDARVVQLVEVDIVGVQAAKGTARRRTG